MSTHEDFIPQLRQNFENYKESIQQLLVAASDNDDNAGTKDEKLLDKKKKRSSKRMSGISDAWMSIENQIKSLESEVKKSSSSDSMAKAINEACEDITKRQKELNKYLIKHYSSSPHLSSITNLIIIPKDGSSNSSSSSSSSKAKTSMSDFEIQQKKKASVAAISPAMRKSSEALLPIVDPRPTSSKAPQVKNESNAVFVGGFFATDSEIPTDIQQLEVELKTTPAVVLEKLIVATIKENPDLAHKTLKRLRTYQKQYNDLKAKKLANKSEGTEGSTENVSDELQKTNIVMKNAVLADWLEVKFDNSRWKKRWAVASDNTIYLFRTPEDFKWIDSISLFGSSIRIREDGKALYFGLLTPQRLIKFCAESEKQVLSWTATLEDICNRIIHETIGTNHMNQEQKAKGIPPEREELYEIMKHEGNSVCADCGSQDPVWVSLNLGIFICIECSGAHRNLGTHISKVRSCQYDLMDKEQLQKLKSVGNNQANLLWEAKVPKDRKPRPDDSLTVKHEFIRAKYIEMSFIDPEKKSVIMSFLEAPPQQNSTPLSTPPDTPNTIKRVPSSGSSTPLSTSTEKDVREISTSGGKKSNSLKPASKKETKPNTREAKSAILSPTEIRETFAEAMKELQETVPKAAPHGEDTNLLNQSQGKDSTSKKPGKFRRFTQAAKLFGRSNSNLN